MERSQGKDSQDRVSPKLRKYIRLQIVGMALFLSWPVAMMLADMYGLDFWIPHISILLVYGGVALFSVGDIGRRRLKEEEERESDSGNRQK